MTEFESKLIGLLAEIRDEIKIMRETKEQAMRLYGSMLEGVTNVTMETME